MRMIITSTELRNGDTYAACSTAIGNICGKWCGKKPPIAGKTYFFELGIDELDRNDISIIDDRQFRPSVRLDDNFVHFEGICENADDIYVIRFCDDWIEMISIKNDDFTICRGDNIAFSLSCDRIGIFPYECF